MSFGDKQINIKNSVIKNSPGIPKLENIDHNTHKA